MRLTRTPQRGVAHGQRRVICYFSAGSAEDFRSDYGKYAAADLGEPLDG